MAKRRSAKTGLYLSPEQAEKLNSDTVVKEKDRRTTIDSAVKIIAKSLKRDEALYKATLDDLTTIIAENMSDLTIDIVIILSIARKSAKDILDKLIYQE